MTSRHNTPVKYSRPRPQQSARLCKTLQNSGTAIAENAHAPRSTGPIKNADLYFGIQAFDFHPGALCIREYVQFLDSHPRRLHALAHGAHGGDVLGQGSHQVDVAPIAERMKM
jgi:hypothetical protein